MKSIEETLTILHIESKHGNKNILGGLEILKTTSSLNILNYIITDRSNPIYKQLPSVQQTTQLNNEVNTNNRAALLMLCA